MPRDCDPARMVVTVVAGLAFVLVLLVIGSGLLYVTLVHPSLAGPLTVAGMGVTTVIAILSGLIALVTHQRRR